MSSADVARMTVNLGDHNIRTNFETQHVVKKVKRIVRHRSFDSRTLYNDVALLTLESPVQYTTNIRPICLPRTAHSFGGNFGTVIGWGRYKIDLNNTLFCTSKIFFDLHKFYSNTFQVFVRMDHNHPPCKKYLYQFGQTLYAGRSMVAQHPAVLSI